MLSNKYKRVKCTDIIVKRDERQRRKISTEDIDDSIKQRGVMIPIIVTDELVLVAGERRLTASIKMGITDIPVRFTGDLTEEELQIVELEENVKRLDLPWRDQVMAYGRLHDLYSERDSAWTQNKTAKTLAVEPPFVSKILRVYRDIDSPRIAQATGIMQAHNILSRVDERTAADAISSILEATTEVVDRGEAKAVEKSRLEQELIARLPAEGQPRTGPAPKIQGVIIPPLPVLPPAPESILQGDFIGWAEGYRGPKFNLVHCDFPYGVNVFKGDQAGKRMWQTEERQGVVYDDDPNVYWQLCDSFCRNLDNFMAQSAHLIFWFGMDTYTETLAFFSKHAPSLVFQKKPLIWLKSDNAGILADPKRGPRNIYEVAFMASRGDRLILRATSNAYSAPTDKEYHPSTKPVPVLKYFFQMVVDENTRLLDPTCGSGSSLRAAEDLGAKEVFGLEYDPQFVVSARSALKKSRTLRKMASKIILKG